MINECNIVRDLLPIYADKATTVDSNKFVKRHLTTCASCNQYYKSVTNRSVVAAPTSELPLSRYEVVAKKLKKRKLIKRILITGGFVGAAAFCAVSYVKGANTNKSGK
jgi:predicted anti-sigma-YlaC factor YlaD